jgi:sulfate adenylyltransferase subunit 1
MDLLRFITAGSVDDGKSTLIGRLLYDSKSILADQLEALERSSRRREDGQVDLALLTDGLRAEREQGITIDVAYRYFSTPRRKFIIADAPGHIHYTRNMITGASHAELVVILVDARHGVVEQTRRHSIIASMLRIPRVVVAINKMDLIGFDEGVYNRIVEDYRQVASRLGLPDVTYIPISALRGDNIVEASTSMPWYEGPSLLRHLEEVEVPDPAADARPRFQVQYVIRPQTADLPDYRGYAGRIAGGVYRKGDAVTVLPLNASTSIARIEVAGREVEEAWAPQSVVLHLEDDIDVGRGDAIIPSGHLPEVRQEFDVMLCWLDEKPLRAGNRYLLQQNSRLVRAVVRSLDHRVDVNTLDALPAGESVGLNEVVHARLRTAAPLACDPFERLPANGSAILIDETGNGTVAAVLFQS